QHLYRQRLGLSDQRIGTTDANRRRSRAPIGRSPEEAEQQRGLDRDDVQAEYGRPAPGRGAARLGARLTPLPQASPSLPALPQVAADPGRLAASGKLRLWP